MIEILPTTEIIIPFPAHADVLRLATAFCQNRAALSQAEADEVMKLLKLSCAFQLTIK